MLISMVVSVPFTANATDTILSKDGLYYYQVIGEWAEFLGVNPDKDFDQSVFYVPSEIDGYTVKYIGSYAFLTEESHDFSPVKVIIPDTVTYIGGYAFYNYKDFEYGMSFTRLEYVDIPSSVDFIGTSAFMYCDKLKKIEFPSNLFYIGENAFRGCDSLKSVTIPETLFNLCKGAFSGCVNLEKVVIEDGVTYINDNLFESCMSLESISIPDSVSYIGEEAFASCRSLKNVSFPKTYFCIKAKAFYNCTALKKVVLHEDVYPGKKMFGYYYDSNKDKEKVNKSFKIDCIQTEGDLQNRIMNHKEFNTKYNLDMSLGAVKSDAGYVTKLKVKGKKVVNWSSSKPTVAKITKSGKVTALTKGTTTLTATYEDGTSETKKLKVLNNPKIYKVTKKTYITIPKNFSIKVGKPCKMKIEGRVSNMKNKYQDTSKAKIIGKANSDTFKIKGLKKGVTNLKITVNGKKLKVKVRVK